jgi:hypothetical protein
VIWVYAICERREPPPMRGLLGAPVDAIREGPLTAVLSHHDHLPTEFAHAALWEHERVVEGAMQDCAVLPVRFGTEISEAALRRTLAERQGELLDALERVRGRVEVAVRAMPADRGPAAPPHDSGRDYLRGKLETRKRNAAAAAALRAPLTALAVSARLGRGQGELCRDAYLVGRDVVPMFRRTVNRLRGEHRDARLVCTGPWPPYSFVAPRETSSSDAP